MDFTVPLTIAKQALEALQGLRKVERALDQATLKGELAGVISQMADIRLALAEAQQEAAEKDAEIARLKAAFAAKGDLVENRQFKFFPSKADSTRPVGLPTCPRCDEVDGRIILLRRSFGQNGNNTTCPQCKSTYEHVPEWTEPRET